MTSITLFEYEESRDTIDHASWQSLERMNRAAGAKILKAVPRPHGKIHLRATQYVGVIRLRNQTVQILPKIYQSEAHHDDQTVQREATRNLLYLLTYAVDFPVREQDLAPLLHRERDWFELLTRLFAKHLTEEWKRGAIRGYTRFEDDLPVLKGKWLISQQLRQPAQQHRFSVAYDEFTADNQVNRVLRYVVERLWRLSTDGENRRVLGQLRHWMDEVTLLPRVTSQDAGQAQLSRLHHHYQPLLNLARLFLDDGTLQLAAGELETFSLVFDMNRLFESFVIGFIRRYRQDVLPASLSECILRPQSDKVSCYLATREPGGRKSFLLKPDLVLEWPGGSPGYPLLLDTKYKALTRSDAQLGIAQDDMYQMFAYAHRYDCPRVLLLYPRTVNMNSDVKGQFWLDEAGKKIDARTVNLSLDMSGSNGRTQLKQDLHSILQGVSQ